MKITCPKCNASGTLPEHEIPESGRFITCPRCKEGFNVTKPGSGVDLYLVDTCPSCGYSAFGNDESFGACPKCGVVIKTFVERQREEQLLKHNQELLGKKFNNIESTPSPSEVSTNTVADLIDNLHPVNLISWSVAAVAIVVVCLGLRGVIVFDTAKTAEILMLESDEQFSRFYIFLHYGLIHWVKLLYGITALTVAVLFMKRLKLGLKALRYLIWATIGLVPVLYTSAFISWMLGPIPHTVSGYLINGMEIIFIGALVGVPLYLLERSLHDRTITSVVKL